MTVRGDCAEATQALARWGPYRILCNINDPANRVDILRVDHRADVYRNG